MVGLGLKLTKAYSYLADVKDHKQVIPFRRFSGGVGRASQAKQFGATQGTELDPSILVQWLKSCARTLARKVGRVHPAVTEERGIECRR
jgi:hypothetical protein